MVSVSGTCYLTYSFGEKGGYSLAISDSNATTRNAMPAQKRLPVRNHTIKATMMAGINAISKRTKTMTIMPMMTRTSTRMMSAVKLPKI
jgi:hypothetical protein